jgi:hypothetical protein
VTFPVTVLSPPDLYNCRHDQSRLFEEAAMNAKTGVSRGLRRAASLAIAAAVAAATTACGVHVSIGARSAGAAPTQSYSYAQELALAQCMRGHGLPTFPDPDPSGGFNGGVLSTFDTSLGQAAYGACRHLLAGGGPSVSQLQEDLQQVQQKEAEMLPELLRFSQCMRSHGVPNYPDPTLTGQGISGNLKGAGMNPNSPIFQAAVSACQHVAPGLSFHFSASRSRA